MPSDISLTSEAQSLLICPVTGSALAPASPEVLETISGQATEGGLINEEGSLLYPIRDGFPILVPEQAIQLPAGDR